MAIVFDEEEQRLPKRSRIVFDDESDHVESDRSQSGPMSEIKRIVDAYKATQFGSPQDLLERLDALVTRGFDKAGEFGAEEMAKSGADPRLSAAVGTVFQMAPDLIRSISPTTEISALEGLKSPARSMARRSLGYMKQDLKTPFAQRVADEASTVALEEKIIPWLGGSKEALSRTKRMIKESGESLGKMRESAGASPLDKVFDSLEMARNEATGGMRGGAWDSIHNRFDEAQETLASLEKLGKDVSLKQVEKVKKLLSNTVNWTADNVSQETAKQISRAIEDGVEDIMRSKGMDMAKYESEKRLFRSGRSMEKALTKKISGETGNNMISLPTMVAAAGQAAGGGLGSAASTLGIVEALRRRGAGSTARLLDLMTKEIVSGGNVPAASIQQIIATLQNRENNRR